MFTKKYPGYLAALALLPAVALVSPVNASAAELEEVIVTAQKRAEPLGKVPVALSVLNEDQINSTFSSSLDTLQAYVPSVSFRNGNTTRNSALTIRGIGTISFSIAGEPSVSTVVDNVVLGRSGQAFGDLYDLERIEVLRGPQGTLFGKNASAGVVNISTKRPGNEFDGYVDTSFYEDNEYRIKARVAGPLSEKVNASLTVLKAEFDGYLDNVFTNKTVNGYNKEGVRAMFDVAIDDTSSALVIFENYEANNDCCDDVVARNTNASRPQDPEVFVADPDVLNLDQRKVDHDFETRTLDETTAFSVQFDKSIGAYTFTSITAHRTWNNTEIREGDFTSENGNPDINLAVDFADVGFQLHDVGPQEWRQFSQELRLTSPGGSKVDWQVGAFYWNIDSVRNFTREASCQVHPNNEQILIDNPDLTCYASDIVSAIAYMSTAFDNFGLFGQGSVAVKDNFSILFGLRYTNDKVSYRHNRTNLDEVGRRGVGVRGAAADTDFADETKKNNFSWKLGAQWQIAEQHMVYGHFATGYKGPGFNVFYNMSDGDTDPINAETSESVEMGYKYSGRRAYASAVFYSTKIDNFQANRFDTSLGVNTTSFTNGGDVETEGIEIDFAVQATDRLKFSGGLAISDAKSTTGAPLPFAPDTKYNVVVDYGLPTANGSEFSANLAYVYTDNQLSGNIGQTAEANPEVFLPSYGIVNASLTYTAPEEKYSISFIIKNLGDKSYTTTFSGDGFRYQIPRDADRHFGVNFRLNF